MKLWLSIGLGVVVLVGWLIIYGLCQVSGIQSDREERRQARYERERKERERDSW